MPPHSVIEWMIGQNVTGRRPRPPKRAAPKREVVRVEVTTDDESGADAISITYPRTGPAKSDGAHVKKVRFDSVLKSALKTSSSPDSSSSSSSSSPNGDSSTKNGAKACKLKAALSDESSDDTTSDSEPHPTCLCRDCRVGRRRARRLRRMKAKAESSDDSSTSESESEPEPAPAPAPKPQPKQKNKGKQKKQEAKSQKKAPAPAPPPTPEPATDTSESDTPGETTDGTQTEGESESEAEALPPPPSPEPEPAPAPAPKEKAPKEKKKAANAGAKDNNKADNKTANTTDNGKDKDSNSSEKKGGSDAGSHGSKNSNSKISKGDMDKAESRSQELPPFSSNDDARPPHLLMPVKAQILQVEHTIETPDDPRPNAFVNNEHGVLRVYHGPAYGNPNGNLYPQRNWSGQPPPLGMPHPLNNPYMYGFGNPGADRAANALPQGPSHDNQMPPQMMWPPAGMGPDGPQPHMMPPGAFPGGHFMPPGWPMGAVPGPDGNPMLPVFPYGPPPGPPGPGRPPQKPTSIRSGGSVPPKSSVVGGLELNFDGSGRPVTAPSSKGRDKDKGWSNNVAPPPQPSAGKGSQAPQNAGSASKDPWQTNDACAGAGHPGVDGSGGWGRDAFEKPPSGSGHGSHGNRSNNNANGGGGWDNNRPSSDRPGWPPSKPPSNQNWGGGGGGSNTASNQIWRDGNNCWTGNVSNTSKNQDWGGPDNWGNSGNSGGAPAPWDTGSHKNASAKAPSQHSGPQKKNSNKGSNKGPPSNVSGTRNNVAPGSWVNADSQSTTANRAPAHGPSSQPPQGTPPANQDTGKKQSGSGSQQGSNKSNAGRSNVSSGSNKNNGGNGNDWNNESDGNNWNNGGDSNNWDNGGNVDNWDNGGNGNNWDNGGSGMNSSPPKVATEAATALGTTPDAGASACPGPGSRPCQALTRTKTRPTTPDRREEARAAAPPDGAAPNAAHRTTADRRQSSRPYTTTTSRAAAAAAGGTTSRATTPPQPEAAGATTVVTAIRADSSLLLLGTLDGAPAEMPAPCPPGPTPASPRAPGSPPLAPSGSSRWWWRLPRLLWWAVCGFFRLIRASIKAVVWVVRGLAMGVLGILFVCNVVAREMLGGFLNWWLLAILACVFGCQARAYLTDSARRDSIFLVPGWL
ncbi:hypothetical protein RB601_007634 [Gaeumannomyces tritici]